MGGLLWVVGQLLVDDDIGLLLRLDGRVSSRHDNAQGALEEGIADLGGLLDFTRNLSGARFVRLVSVFTVRLVRRLLPWNISVDAFFRVMIAIPLHDATTCYATCETPL